MSGIVADSGKFGGVAGLTDFHRSVNSDGSVVLEVCGIGLEQTGLADDDFSRSG